MVEKKTIIDGESITYKGLFNPQELYKLIDKYFKEKGYDKQSLANEEHISEDHKDVLSVILPTKSLTDNEKSEIKVVIMFNNLKEQEKIVDGVKMKLYNGSVTVVFSAYLKTDYEGRWDQKPFYFFFKTMADKFLYSQELGKMEGIIKDHVKEIKEEIFSFLNMKRWT